MRLFVYEYTCGPALPPELESLRPQGAAMLQAVLEDFARLPDVSVLSLVSGHTVLAGPGVTLIRSSADEERDRFRACLAEADMALVIAPEFEDLLYERVRWVEEAGVPMLNPTSAAIQLCGDKLGLCGHLQARGVPTPTCRLVEKRGEGRGARGEGGGREQGTGDRGQRKELATLTRRVSEGGISAGSAPETHAIVAPREAPTRNAASLTRGERRETKPPQESSLVPRSPPLAPSFPAVLKRRHGAGSLATFLVHSDDELAAALHHARSSGLRDDVIVQPLIPGRAASVSFLVGPRGAVPLAPAWQIVSEDGRFDYLGGILPIERDFAARAIALAGRAMRAVPGLHGYVGVDVVLGRGSDGADDRVIEINPRLTTSYVGLRALACENLARCLLDVAADRQPSLTWRRGCSIRFDPTGRIVESVLPGSAES